MQTFFGVEVTPGKVAPFVPPPVEAPLHISQATLSFDAKAGERVGVTAKVDEDGPDLLICSLREGTSESQSLDLIFDSYAEFKVVGNASVHLTGYYMPEHDHEDEESDEDEEGEDEEDTDEDEEMANISPADLRALAAYSRKHGMPMADEDDDEDDEEHDEDEDEDDEDEDDDIARKASVIIRELNQDGSAKSDTDEDEDDDEDDEEDDEEDDDEDVPAGGVQIDEDIDRATVQLDDTIKAIGAAAEASAKRKGAAADKERSSSKRAKKAADIARSTAEDLIMQAMEDAEDDIEAAEDDAEDDKAPEADAEDIIDVAAAAGPAVEDVAAAVKAAAAEMVDAGAAAEKPLSKKEKKRRAKEAAANGQIKVNAAEPASNSVPIKHTRPKVQKFDNGFIIEDTHMGPAQGKEAKPGNKVGVRYKGWLAKNNQVFDQTKGSKTFNFRVGVGEVIKGWDRGVVGMRPGDKRRLTVPPQMAYGPTGVKGAIPGNATLVFDVELVDVKGK